MIEGFCDVSEILSAGVYALVAKGEVVYVGQSKSLYARIYTHRYNARRPAPSWMPVKGIVFDKVWIRPCRFDELDSLERDLIGRYRPRYNTVHKPTEKIPLDALLASGVAFVRRF